jgi:hypothetical protein
MEPRVPLAEQVTMSVWQAPSLCAQIFVSLRPHKCSQLENTLIAMQVELLQARRHEAELELAAEQPRQSAQARRVLPGSVPSVLELQQRHDEVMTRLVKKEARCELAAQRLAEAQQMLIDEQTSLEANGQPLRGPPSTLASQLLESKTKAREATERLMALVAELSMQQATSLQLEQQVHAQEQTLAAVTAKMAAGEVPLAEWEAEWAAVNARTTGAHRALQTTAAQQTQRHEQQQQQGPSRPNAYMADMFVLVRARLCLLAG